MTTEILLALGIPAIYLLISTALLRLSTRRAIAGNTMVELSIGLGALRWALNR